MDRTYTIRNLHSKAIEVELAHQQVCVRLGRCLCTDGASACLRIARGRKVIGQPAAIALCPAVAAHEKAGRLVVSEEAPAGVAASAVKPPRSEGRQATKTNQARRGAHGGMTHGID